MLTYEDYTLGRRFPLGPRFVSQEEIIEFASEFDPQPFHLDPQSAQAEQIGGLIASGWHTCSMCMRMMCDSYLLDSASLGSNGLDEVRWLHPVRPDDTLSGSAIVVERKVSRSRPEMGIVTMNYEINNQDDVPVMTISGVGLIKTEAAI